MLPVVAIVGRPNVGKSTLFNRLTRTRDAVITDFPGTTRDRQFGEVHTDQRHFIIIDTGGITDEKDEVDQHITRHALQAIQDADKILFVIDGKAGVNPEDRAIAEILRRSGKTVFLAVNKTENIDTITGITEAHELAMGNPVAIAAAHGRGITQLIQTLFPEPNEQEAEDDADGIKLAIIGRPNVGKSTLTNRILGEDRVIVHDSPGTTRDSIRIPLERFGKHYTIIDTAGMRKRAKIRDSEDPEKFSVVKTLQAIESSNVVLYVVDARIAVSEQDMKLLGFVLECGKALVIAINKWDGMTEEDRNHARNTVDRQLDFVSFARLHFISALHGSGVGDLFKSIDEAYESATRKLSTPEVTRILQKAVEQHAPPMIHGHRVKMRYAHPGGSNPPIIVVHGNQLNSLPESYRRYLSNYFQTKLKLYGTPIKIQFKTTTNPFA